MQLQWHMASTLGCLTTISNPSSLPSLCMITSAADNFLKPAFLHTCHAACWRKVNHDKTTSLRYGTVAGDWLAVAVSASPQTACILMVAANLTVTAKVLDPVCAKHFTTTSLTALLSSSQLAPLCTNPLHVTQHCRHRSTDQMRTRHRI